MSNLETLRYMLADSNIAFVEYDIDAEALQHISSAPKEAVRILNIGESYGDIIRVSRHKPHIGYSDFFASFYFDKDGALINIGVWEQHETKRPR